MKSYATLYAVDRLAWRRTNSRRAATLERKSKDNSSSRSVFSTAIPELFARLIFFSFGFSLLELYSLPAMAGLEGAVIVGGQGAIINSNLVRQDSSRLAINATGFGVKLGETFTLQQKYVTDIALIRVVGQNPSDILGNINAKGQLFISNPNGILFGKNAQVNVGGLVATSLWLDAADFMADKYSFLNTGKAGSVVNQGRLIAANGGYIALLAPEVVNEGVISAKMGTAVLAAGDKVTLNIDDGSLLGYTIDKGALSALVENRQLVKADGGQVFMGAKAASKLGTAVVNNTGIVRARSVGSKNGVISLSGDYVVQAGTLDVSGESGGSIGIEARAIVDAGKALANGSAGAGGNIHYHATESLVRTASASMQADGTDNGGNIRLQSNGSLFSSGAMRAVGKQGGVIDVLGERIVLAAADIDASGSSRGGKVRIGGDFHGKNSDIPNAKTVFINGASKIKADGGNGQVAIWSDEVTDYYGSISANLAGMIEVSSKGQVNYGGFANAGEGGSLLLDPANIIISESAGPAAFELLDPHAATGNLFGDNLVALGTTVDDVFTASGKVVIGVNGDDLAAIDAGAAYLFDTHTGALLSMLTGSRAGDQVGKEITALANGNYVVTSHVWDNGAVLNAGAVTWGNGVTGVSGVVSGANSLVGTATYDQVGLGGVTALTNGNYVVNSHAWNNGTILRAGAATFGNGTTGIMGAVSSNNSLVGAKANDRVGLDGVYALTNGHYVVSSSLWDNGAILNAGAATWGSGSAGISGLITGTNSLVGTTANNNVGIGGVTALANGHYVVNSFLWDDGSAVNVGAVTWGNGASGTSGNISAANSLIGANANDSVGRGGVTVLKNGNYVVNSYYWDNGLLADAGAVTWGNGAIGTAGLISNANSLVGASSGDMVGFGGVTALTNGHYAVNSYMWKNGAAGAAGAVTWGNGTVGTNGVVSEVNSLVGTATGDLVGFGGVTALANGHYVVNSYVWDNASIVNAGAVTWGNGVSGTAGAVSNVNSLVGVASYDQVGNGGVTALTNGNYVVSSHLWDNGAVVDAGAATWANGSTGISGSISSANSLIGTSAGDSVASGGVTSLSNGNYVVSSQGWRNGNAINAGAATWGSGNVGITGTVSGNNSLVGTNTFDAVGSGGVTALTDGNYVVSSHLLDHGLLVDVGAVTLGNGALGTSGAVNPINSLVGTVAHDQVGSGGISTLAAGDYLVASPQYASSKGQVLVSGFHDVGFNTALGQTMTFNPSALTETLAAGTSVTLQASNDITVNAAINVAGTSGGAFTLQAGRNINLNSDIVTANGNFIAVAGDPGAVAADRLAGTPTITLGAGASVNAGTGKVTLAAIGGDFVNNSGSATPISASQWTVYSSSPSSNVLGGMTAGEHYGQTYFPGTTPADAMVGNWLMYSAAAPVPVDPPVVPPTPPLDAAAIAELVKDAIVVANKPPVEKSVVAQKPLMGGCGGETLVVSSASSVLGRFINTEDISSGLDSLIDDSAEKNCVADDGKKVTCPVDQPGKVNKDKSEQL